MVIVRTVMTGPGRVSFPDRRISARRRRGRAASGNCGSRWPRGQGCRSPPSAIERGVVEGPFGRGLPPDGLRKVAPDLVVADQAALGGEIELIPPLELGRRRQGRLAGFLAADQIAADRDQRLAALGPKRGDNIGRASAP